MSDDNQDPMSSSQTFIEAEITIVKGLSIEGRPFVRLAMSEDISGYDAFAMLEQAKFIVNDMITGGEH